MHLEWLQQLKTNSSPTVIPLWGHVPTDVSESAGLWKHRKEAEKVLLKEFQQFKNMDMMEVLNLDTLTIEQKEQALGMVNILQEKRDHTPP